MAALVVDSGLKEFRRVFYGQDIRISVYADDTLLSSDDVYLIEKSEEYIRERFASYGLTLNDRKRKVGSKGTKFFWLGLQIHPWTAIPRSKLLNLQRQVYLFNTKEIIPENFIPKNKKIERVIQWRKSVAGEVVFAESVSKNNLLKKTRRSIDPI